MADRETPVMAQLVRAMAIKRRRDSEVEQLVARAMDDGENQAEIARIIARSREHLRTIRRRVKAGQGAHAARLPNDKD